MFNLFDDDTYNEFEREQSLLERANVMEEEMTDEERAIEVERKKLELINRPRPDLNTALEVQIYQGLLDKAVEDIEYIIFDFGYSPARVFAEHLDREDIDNIQAVLERFCNRGIAEKNVEGNHTYYRLKLN